MSGFGQAPFGYFPFGEGIVPPVVENWLPALGTDIPRLSPISFDVTSRAYPATDVAIRLITSTGIDETVWTDTGGFTDAYRRGSARVPKQNGYHFVVRRTKGWPGAITSIVVTAQDLVAESA